MGGQGRSKGSRNKTPRPPSLEVGKTYGIWTILEYEGSRHRYPDDPDHRKDQFWRSQCGKCGKIESRTTAQIRGFPDACRCGMVVPDASFHRAYRTYKRQGRVRALAFELTLDDFKKLVVQDCYYCGKKPELNSYSEDSKIRIPMNGIDRRNSGLAYTVDNCIPACGTCNLAKLDYTEKDFLKWVGRVSSFQREQLFRSISTAPAVCFENVPKPDDELESEESE